MCVCLCFARVGACMHPNAVIISLTVSSAGIRMIIPIFFLQTLLNGGFDFYFRKLKNYLAIVKELLSLKMC